MTEREQPGAHDWRIVVAAVGDIHGGENPPQLSDELRSLLAGADVVIVNQESPLSGRGQPQGGKGIYLRSSPGSVSLLREMNATVAALANNHICDWSDGALEETLEILDEAGIRSTGAAFSAEEASRPVIVQVQGVSLGVLAYADPTIQLPPTVEQRCRVADLDEARAIEAVKSLRSQVECVIVCLHWGLTNYHYPSPQHVRLGRALIDAGATLVLGHHPHVVQGVERYGKGLIAYSLGNFAFVPYVRGGRTMPLSRENRSGLAMTIRLGREGVLSVEEHHTLQDGRSALVERLGGSKASRRSRLLRRLSRPLGRQDYAAFYRRYVLWRFAGRLLRWLHPRQWLSINRDYLRGVRAASGILMQKPEDASK